MCAGDAVLLARVNEDLGLVEDLRDLDPARRDLGPRRLNVPNSQQQAVA